MILVSFNQALTQSVTLTQFIFLQEDNEWVQDISKKVIVPLDKVVNCFSLLDSKILILFSNSVLVLDKQWKEVNRTKFNHKLVSANKSNLRIGDSFWLVFETELLETADHTYEGGEDPSSSLMQYWQF